jgi:hypothetical protein
MAIDMHTVSTSAGADPWAFGDRIHISKLTLAYAAGSGAGASSTATIPATLLLPGASVFISALPAGVSASVSGNAVTLTPASGTLAAGSVAILVIG